MRAIGLALAILTAASSLVRADDDPFVAGAHTAWLEWAVGNCSGSADAAILGRLQRIGAGMPDSFADGQRAARRSIEQSLGEAKLTELCAVMVRDFGPKGLQIKGAFQLQ